MHSPFDRSTERPIEDSANWMSSFVVGELAVTLCVVAVAFLGFLLLSGRIAVRRGITVLLGSFVVLGAPIIAAAFTGLARNGGTWDYQLYVGDSTTPVGRELPTATYDPYAGASLRDDR